LRHADHPPAVADALTNMHVDGMFHRGRLLIKHKTNMPNSREKILDHNLSFSSGTVENGVQEIEIK
jgi:hypothetical protein